MFGSGLCSGRANHESADLDVSPAVRSVPSDFVGCFGFGSSSRSTFTTPAAGANAREDGDDEPGGERFGIAGNSAEGVLGMRAAAEASACAGSSSVPPVPCASCGS